MPTPISSAHIAAMPARTKSSGLTAGSRDRLVDISLWTIGAVLVGGIVYQSSLSGGGPDPLSASSTTARVVDISVLVFREGLEFILVLAALTANMSNERRQFQRPIAAGAALAVIASLITWQFAVTIVDSLAENISALHIQAATGLLAIIVLVIVMNWFFHKIYWTGWIASHSRKKQDLLQQAEDQSSMRIWWGLALLGFTSLFREGFEIVLFLQSYRLKLGGQPVLYGFSVGLFFTILVGLLTFGLRRRLPYRKMLVVTGILLGVVLLVMVGEQAQEMQLAGWLPTTPVTMLEHVIPDWMQLWFAVFPTVETLASQTLAAIIVVGSYVLAEHRVRKPSAAS
jgi:high-affinity iron transporter